MTLTADDLRYVLDRLHQPYLAALAEEIRVTVGLNGRVIATAYEPGDGTSYALIFTPLNPITERAHVRRGYESLGEDPEAVIEGRPIETRLGIGEPDGRYVLVSYVEHGAYPFELFIAAGAGRSLAFFEPGYVADKLGIKNPASAVAVAALLNEIAGARWPE